MVNSGVPEGAKLVESVGFSRQPSVCLEQQCKIAVPPLDFGKCHLIGLRNNSKPTVVVPGHIPAVEVTVSVINL